MQKRWKKADEAFFTNAEKPQQKFVLARKFDTPNAHLPFVRHTDTTFFTERAAVNAKEVMRVKPWLLEAVHGLPIQRYRGEISMF